jgi:CheY-like chemotaxis protein
MDGSIHEPFSFVINEEVNILVVDDDPIMLEFARVYLTTPSARVDTAEDGQSGLSRLRAKAFDIALVDLDMPIMNGFDLIRQIGSDDRLNHIPVIRDEQR